MPLSQFKIYMSSDSGSPILTGQSGSLISLLDGVLVNGYGSKTPAGWTKPFPNSSSVSQSFASNQSLGCWKQPSGSQLTLYVNDSAPNLGANAGTKEAWATGWEILYALTSSVSSASVGGGIGQFPLPAQLLTTGHVVVKKSLTADGTYRPWICFADAWTFYLFMFTSDSSGNTYNTLFFGDIFSFKPSTDTYKCFIAGRVAENANATTNAEGTDLISLPQSTTSGQHVHWIARSFGGMGQSSAIIKLGDAGKMAAGLSAQHMPMAGNIAAANPVDNSYYMAPIMVAESSVAPCFIRGRFRGMYMLCHPLTSFADGQIFSGANEYAGKTFMVINHGVGNNIGQGMWAIETSPTLETN